MEDCLFCKIINGKIPSEKVYEDELCYAFKDINPMAPVHILFIPKEHICGVDGLNENNCAIVGHIFNVIARTAKELKLDNGYRVVSNVGSDGGQTVRHLHFHLIGGKKLDVKMA